MATEGSCPPKICPVIIPGKEIKPTTEVVAIVGLRDFTNASFIKLFSASFFVAPFAKANLY